MLKYSFRSTAVIILISVIAIYSASYFLGDRLANLLPAFVHKSLNSSFGSLSGNSFLLTSLSGFKNKAQDFENLKEENRKLLSELASLDELKSENEFLREAVGLRPRIKGEFVEAGIFSISYDPGGHTALLDVGSRKNDAIKVGDVVVTSGGMLAGIIVRVLNNYSEVMLLTDTKFKVTVRTVEKSVAGIASGRLNNGLAMDFVSHNEEVAEGNLVLSSGNDMMPAGLIIGKIDHVELIPGSVFQNIRIKPSISGLNLGKVMVIIQ